MNPDSKPSDRKTTHTENTVPLYNRQKPIKRPWVRRSLLALLVLGALVFFWLPTLVEKPTINSEQKTASPVSGVRHIDSSPWLEAQQARQRKSAQEILAQLLALQFLLEEKQARRWAEIDFQSVEKMASEGDKFYRGKSFVDAAASYKSGLSKLREIDANTNDVLETLLKEGNGFLQDHQSDGATQRFQLALAIDPESQAAQLGLKRAGILDQVVALQKKAKTLFSANRIEDAVNTIKAAAELDPENKESRLLDLSYSQRLLNINFNSAMSDGYENLFEKQYPQAELAFKRAISLKPGSTEAAGAREELINKRSLEQISHLQQQAQLKENTEQWGRALTLYEDVLALDKNLIFARVGIIRTRARENLEKNILAALENPQRLNEEPVYREARGIYNDAIAIAKPGPRLLQQSRQLSNLLKTAAQPLSISFQSDEQTTIRISRVGSFGKFLSRQIELKPGKYTAVGTRQGYRDIREEFVVSATLGQAPIVIFCSEPI